MLAVQTIKNIKLYNVIKKRHLTDKTYKINKIDSSYYCFFVDNKADKILIKKAVEEIFNVKVSSVNTLIRNSISKSFKGNRSIKKEKIAYVKLSSGSIGEI